MKKILFFAAALAVVSLTSCGSGNKEAEGTDTVNKEVGGTPAATNDNKGVNIPAGVDTILSAEGVITGYVDANGDTTMVVEIAESESVVPVTNN